MNDQDVVDAFVLHLRENGYPGLNVERRPDKDNRDSSDIDAIAGPFAIEHTSIDTLPDQRKASDWFMRITGGIDKELQTAFPYRLSIVLEYDAISRGQNWGAIRQNLKNWIINESGKLEDRTHNLEKIQGIPFSLHVTKGSNRPPGLVFGRFEPIDESLPKRLRVQLDRRFEKLTKYRSSGKTTVLLLESQDLALMNEHRMLQAIRKAYPDGIPRWVDQVWYADTSILDEIEFTDFTQPLRGH